MTNLLNSASPPIPVITQPGRRRMNAFKVLIPFAIILSSCTTYKPMGIAGGFEETPLAANAYKIHTRGNAFASASKVRAIALVRAVELTRNNGYDRFPVHSVEDWEKNYTVRTSPGTVQRSGSAVITSTGNTAFLSGQSRSTYTPPSYTTFSKPHTELVVQMMKQGDPGYKNGLIPDQIFNTYGPLAGYDGP